MNAATAAAKYGLDVSGVIHVGAHLCEEMGAYTRELGLAKRQVLWLEAQPKLVAAARAADPSLRVVQAVALDVDDAPVSFMVASYSPSSSALSLKAHLQAHPDIVELRRDALQASTLDTLLAPSLPSVTPASEGETKRAGDAPGAAAKAEDVKSETKTVQRTAEEVGFLADAALNANYLVMDVQGAELMALRGFQRGLARVQFAFLEISETELYAGGALFPEVDAFMRRAGFVLLNKWLNAHRYGDGLWMRPGAPLRSRVPPSLRSPASPDDAPGQDAPVRTFVVVHSVALLLEFAARYAKRWPRLTFVFVGRGDTALLAGLTSSSSSAPSSSDAASAAVASVEAAPATTFPEVVVASALAHNIEDRPELVAYTAWWALVRNGLAGARNLLLEYDVEVRDPGALVATVEAVLTPPTVAAVGFVREPNAMGFHEPGFDDVLECLGLDTRLAYGPWLASSNQAVSGSALAAFVDWFDALLPRLALAVPTSRIAFYHERLFTYWLRVTRVEHVPIVHGSLLHNVAHNSHGYCGVAVPPSLSARPLAAIPTFGRTIKPPADFDWRYYLAAHPDLGAAGLRDEAAARLHWTRHGCGEGRRHAAHSHTSERRALHRYGGRRGGARVLVESGTRRGDGVADALACGYARVVSLEIDAAHHLHCLRRFRNDARVELVLGSSATGLAPVLATLNEPAVFWLDAHYSSPIAGVDSECPCPLRRELAQIAAHPVKTHTLLIDDRRLLMKQTADGKVKAGGAPRAPGDFDVHEAELVARIRAINPAYQFCYENGYVEDDILVAFVPAPRAPTAVVDRAAAVEYKRN